MQYHKANTVIEKYVSGSESRIIERYIEHGPQELKKFLKVNEEEWQCIFDYLVFDCNLIYKVVIQNLDFFVEEYVEEGVTHVRELLNISEDKYDKIWKVLFDLLAIANSGVEYHFLQHRQKYLQAFRMHGGDFVRKILGLWDDKYEESWLKVLDGLLHGVCEAAFVERDLDENMRGFGMIYNGVREHRIIR